MLSLSVQFIVKDSYQFGMSQNQFKIETLYFQIRHSLLSCYPTALDCSPTAGVRALRDTQLNIVLETSCLTT